MKKVQYACRAYRPALSKERFFFAKRRRGFENWYLGDKTFEQLAVAWLVFG